MKINRNYRFVLTVMNNQESVNQESVTGDVLFRSECHYYAEAELLGAVKQAEKDGKLSEYTGKVYLVYKEEKPKKVKECQEVDGKKITTEYEVPGAAMLIETIQVTESGVTIE